MQIILKECGIPEIEDIIDQAYNGQDALDKVRHGVQSGHYTYGLIFMDCQMPFMDGYEASDEIRRYHKTQSIDQPMIVACTGHTEYEYIQKAWRHQMDEVISKPTSVQVVKTILQDIVKP